MIAYAMPIRWGQVAADAFWIFVLIGTVFSGCVAIVSIRSRYVRDTQLAGLLRYRTGVHLTVWSAILSALCFLIGVVQILFHLFAIGSPHMGWTLFLVQMGLAVPLFLLAAYETLRWRLQTPRAVRRSTRGGDYDLNLAFILLLLFFSVLIRFLPIPWRGW